MKEVKKKLALFCEVLKEKKKQKINRFADNLKMYRETNNYTQKDLAQLLGISQATLAAWEARYNKPSKETQELVFQKIGVKF